MIALVYSDLQATDGHEKCHGDPTVPLQIARVDAFYQMLLRIYEEHNCTCLWDLGDTTDDRSSIPVPAIDAVCSNLSQFPRNDWSLKLIGNHEQYLRNTHVHVGKMFAPYFNITEGNDAFVVPGKKVRILASSYPADERDTVEWLRAQRKEAKQAGEKVILLGHFQVAGSMTGDGQVLTGIPKDELSWVDLGLLGHIHKPQSITKNVHYIGSPFQQNWGERGEAKRVGIVDILKGTVKWVPLEGFPQYLEVNVDEFADLCDKESEDRFKVVLKSQKEAAKFYALTFAHRAEPIYDFDVTSRESDTSDTKKITGNITENAWTFNAVMERYVQQNKPEDHGVPATVEEMVAYGEEIVAK